MLNAADPGTSKFGATMNVSTPPVLMANLPASAPLKLYVGVVPSGSVATTVAAAVWFSAALADAVAPPVITGASLTAVTVMVMVVAADLVPPLPVLPPSLMLMSKVTLAVAS